MPPKRDVNALLPDLNPFGAFVNISVQEGCLSLELPPLPASPTKASKQADAALPSVALLPKTHLVCTYCSEWAPLTGTPTQAGANEYYAYDFASRFRRDADIDGLHDLLNGTLQLSVHDSATNILLASTTVDTLDFGLGHQAIELDALPLEPNPAVPPSCAKVLPGSQLRSLRLWLTHRPAPSQAPTPQGLDPVPGSGPALAPDSPSGPSEAGGSPPAPRSLLGTPASQARPASVAASVSRPPGPGSVTPDQAAAAAALAEADLPPPQPFTFLSPDQLQGATLVELRVAGVQHLPPALPPLVASATEGRGGGRVSFMLGMALPGGAPPLRLAPGVLLTPGSAQQQQQAQSGASSGGAGQAGGLAAGGLPQVVFPQPCRRLLLTAAQTAALKDALEDGVPLTLELARFLSSDTLADAAWGAYRAQATLPNTHLLLEPGATLLPASPATTPGPGQEGCGAAHASPGVPGQEATGVSEAAGQSGARLPLAAFSASDSALPPYRPPAGKAVKEVDEVPAPGYCAWAAAGSYLEGVQLRLVLPLVPPLQPPPPPPLPLHKLMTQRRSLPPYRRPTAASHAFAAAAKAMAQAVASLQLRGVIGLAKAGSMGSKDLGRLAGELSAAGLLQQLQDAMVGHVAAVLQERCSRGLDGQQLGSQDRAVVLQELHATMSAALRAAVHSIEAELGGEGEGRAAADCGLQGQEGVQRARKGLVEGLPADTAARAAAQGRSELQRLLALALESEAAGQVTRAEALHQRRVLVRSAHTAATHKDSGTAKWAEGAAGVEVAEVEVAAAEETRAEEAGAWYEYGCFCLRQGPGLQGRAAQCLAHALALQPDHLRALAAQAALLLHQGTVTDSLKLEAARHSTQRLLSSTPEQLHASGLPPGLALGLLLLITQASGDAASAADTATALTGLQAAESASLLAPDPSQEGDPPGGLAAALTPGTSPSQANGLLAVAQLAVGLGLPAIALAAVQLAAAELTASSALPQVKLELDLAAAQAYCTIHCWEVAQLPATEQTLAAAEQQAACASAASSSSTADYDTSSSDREAAREAGVEAARSAVAAGQGRVQQAFRHCQELCQAAAASAPAGDIRAAILLGDLHWQADQHREAVHAYVRGLHAAAAAAGAAAGAEGALEGGGGKGRGKGQGKAQLPVRLYLRLGESYLHLNLVEASLNTYMLACVHHPCASAWLGVAAARTLLEEGPAAEAALAQAAAQDPEEPRVWAQLALAALRAQRWSEVHVAMAAAMRLGLSDPILLQQAVQGLLAAPLDAGLRPQATACLELLLRLSPPAPKHHSHHHADTPGKNGASPSLGDGAVALEGLAGRLRLVELQLDCGDVAGARGQLGAARRLAVGAAEKAEVEALAERLRSMGGTADS
ncbi:hypothetical protein V8C86DRAFT_3140916 [Haematococcus lacustris]